MTCIVGIETPEGVMMGCDSMSAAHWDAKITRLDKVFQVGAFLIGYTSSFRMGQLLQYGLNVEPQASEESDLAFLVTKFVPAVRLCFKEGGFTRIEASAEEGGEFLVGYKHRLYVVRSDFQVNSSMDGFNSVGCGCSYALGNLFSSAELHPEARINDALEAASHFSNGVCPPFKRRSLVAS